MLSLHMNLKNGGRQLLVDHFKLFVAIFPVYQHGKTCCHCT